MCPTLTVGSLFRRVRSTFLFICSTTSNLNNSNLRSASKTERKNNRRPEPRKHTLAPLFFSTFFEVFGLHQRVPLHLFRYFATQWMSKNRKGSPFYIFRHCDTVQISHFKNFFGKFFHVPKGSPLQFFFIFCNQLEFHKARRVPPFQF